METIFSHYAEGVRITGLFISQLENGCTIGGLIDNILAWESMQLKDLMLKVDSIYSQQYGKSPNPNTVLDMITRDVLSGNIKTAIGERDGCLYFSLIPTERLKISRPYIDDQD